MGLLIAEIEWLFDINGGRDCEKFRLRGAHLLKGNCFVALKLSDNGWSKASLAGFIGKLLNLQIIR